MNDPLSELQLESYSRKPFVIKAVRVTVDNIHDLAQYIGTVQYKDDVTPFILVDRTKVPNLERVYPGFWATFMDKNIRCYSDRVFRHQFQKT